jgi:hypothetical protein
MKTSVFSLGLFLLLAVMVPGSNVEAKTPLTEKQALSHLISRIQKDKLYDSWTTLSCLSIFVEEKTKKHFDITIREKHEGNCLGDPLTAPIVDRFRVDRLTGKIQRYDPADGDLHPYKDAVRSRREK